ncbi:acid phosphatase 1-like [Macadamia integrifolia]|uniref:acid phosphatase 1-like n=1 Tax=Macadamia integrifolia TaxID=60698 RepID=UPI001C4F0251|nr:acid phosphatase 1-like [Macadamia integrifolia]
MNRLLGFLLLLGLFSIGSTGEKFDSHLLPRPLILEYSETHESQLKGFDDDEVQLKCTSWRFAVEANNLNPWKTIPPECASYVKDYMTSRAYSFDLERVSMEAGSYARSLQLAGDGMDAWIFDIDETLLSNLPYYFDHGFGLEVFDSREFDKWVEKAAAPSIDLSLKLYKEVLGLGFKVFLLTGRTESQRTVTVENLRNAGFQDWDKLILRALEDHGKTATLYKSEKRNEMVKEGYRILGNSGDQWSDLLGYSISNRSFKLPNPMYYIP